MPPDHVRPDRGADLVAPDSAVEAEQTRLLLQNPIGVPATLINACLVAVIVWPLYPAGVLALWLGLFSVVSLHRHLLGHRHAGATGSAKTSPNWARVFTLNTFVAGCLWGLSASVILMTPDPIYYNFIVFVLGGMMAGSIVSFAVNLRAMLAFMLPAILPAIVALVVHGGLVQIDMAVMLALFTCALVWTGLGINRLITENIRLRLGQERLVASLRSSEASSALLAAIVDSSDDAIISETVAGKIVSWNRGAEHLFGYRAEEAIGENIRMIIPEERRDEIDRNVAAIANHDGVEPFDTERLRKDGTRVPVSIAVSLTRDAKQAVVGASFIARDISERRVAADALAYRDRLSHAVTVGTGILVKAHSLDRGMPEALRVVGEGIRVDRILVVQALVGHIPPISLRHFWEATEIQMPITGTQFPIDALVPAVVAAWAGLLTNGKPIVVQLATSEGPVRELLDRLRNKSMVIVPIFVGDAFWGALSADACKTAREWSAGEVNMLRTFADIAGTLIQRNEAQLALETSEAGFRALTATAQDAIITIDGAARIGLWNPAAERILGYTAEEALGKQVHEFLAPRQFRAKADSGMNAFFGTGQGDAIGKTTELAALRKDGTEIAVELSLSALPVGDGWGAVGVLRDITERSKAAAALAYRGRLMHAVANGTAILLAEKSLDQSMPEALRILGEALSVDRVQLDQEDPDPTPPPTKGEPSALHYHWWTPGYSDGFGFSSARLSTVEIAVLQEMSKQFNESKFLINQLATSTGPSRTLMEQYRVKSALIMPIFFGKRRWGTLGIDACAVEREWTATEIETLRNFADIAGSLIQRDEARLLVERSEERFRVLTATAQDAIISTDGAGMIYQWNQSAERLFGYSAKEAFGKQVRRLLDPSIGATQPDPDLVVEGDTVGKTLEFVATRKDGIQIIMELSLSGAWLGGQWETIGILRDITGRKHVEEKLEFANLLLRTQMEASLDGILIVDENKAVVMFNQRFATIWKIPAKELAAGGDVAVLAKVTSSVKDAENFSARVRHLYDNPGEDSQDEYETTDGRSIDRYTVTLYSPSRAYLGRAWFFRDITERKRIEALALRMARYDVLTGLANRAVFVEALQHAIATAKRGEKSFAVLYLDLDHFKDVNDTLGHPVGDELLRAVADRLTASTRETDTVARFGGDEFAIIVSDIRDPADAAMLADKLITAFAIPFSVQGSEIHSGASIGIAAYGSEAADAETLLSHADVALYRAKSEGRGGYRFFTDAMDTDVQTRVALGAELRIAIDDGQLFLMYQPQVAIDTGRITGVEALVRWRHPKRGVLGPDLFIPIAEQIGIIAKLGHWVLWEACRQGKAWLDDGVAPVRISVNVSALQFRAPVALEADIAAALAQTGLPARMLELELTESVLMDASREHSDLLQRLRTTGVTIAIDDFGTGYSSLDYLRRFPSNRIKIAQNFVTNLETTPGDAAIIRATIGLARELNIDVIAEGVETQVQRDLLKDWGCGEVQGYLFAKPLTAEDTGAALRDGKISPPEVGTVKAAKA